MKIIFKQSYKNGIHKISRFKSNVIVSFTKILMKYSEKGKVLLLRHKEYIYVLRKIKDEIYIDVIAAYCVNI